MGKKKKKGKKKGGGFALRGDPPEAEIKSHDLIRAEGLKLFDEMSQQIFTQEAPSYVNFLYTKEQAAIALANADKPKKAGGKKKGKKGKKGSKKKGTCRRLGFFFFELSCMLDIVFVVCLRSITNTITFFSCSKSIRFSQAKRKRRNKIPFCQFFFITPFFFDTTKKQ